MEPGHHVATVFPMMDGKIPCVCLQLSCSPVVGAAPLQRMICACLDAAGSVGTRLHPPHHHKLCSCSEWVELQKVPWERNPGLQSTNKNQISSRNQGRKSLSLGPLLVQQLVWLPLAWSHCLVGLSLW